jgi:hypothetical protein
MSITFQQMCVEHGLLCAAALRVSVFYCERNHFLMQWEVFIPPSLCQCYHMCVNDICQ